MFYSSGFYAVGPENINMQTKCFRQQIRKELDLISSCFQPRATFEVLNPPKQSNSAAASPAWFGTSDHLHP